MSIAVQIVAEFDGGWGSVVINVDQIRWLAHDVGNVIEPGTLPIMIREVLIANGKGIFRQWIPPHVRELTEQEIEGVLKG